MADVDVSAAQQAIQTATQYPAQLHDAAVAAQAVPLGPWNVSVTCKYGASDNSTASFSKAFDFTAGRQKLQATLNDAQTSASSFFDTFSFVKTWLSKTVPATSTYFDTADTAIQAAIASAKAGTLTAAERTAVVNALNALVTSLNASKSELTTGNQQLAALAVKQSNYGTAISGVVKGVETDAQNAITAVQAQIAQMPCGAADANRQLVALISNFTTASQQFSTIFGKLAGETSATQNALSVLIGTVTNLIGMYQPVITQVQSTQDAQMASLLQGFKLDIAKNSWAKLAAYGQSQMQSQRAAMQAQLTAHASVANQAPMSRSAPLANIAAAAKVAPASVNAALDKMFGAQS